jgi:hypothetical protein
MLPVPACSHIQYNNTSSKLLGKNLNVLLQKSPDYKTGQILSHLLSKLAENLASFGMGQGFYLL